MLRASRGLQALGLRVLSGHHVWMLVGLGWVDASKLPSEPEPYKQNFYIIPEKALVIL